MDFKIYEIEGLGYVCKGKCFHNLDTLHTYLKKHYDCIITYDVKKADERATAYWMNHWNGL